MDRSAYEHDDGHGRDPRRGTGGRVLWGRVIVLVLALGLMFFLGRCTAASGPSDEEEVERLERRVEELEGDKRDLEAQIEAMAAGGIEDDERGEADDDADRDSSSDGDQGSSDGDGSGDGGDDSGDGGEGASGGEGGSGSASGEADGAQAASDDEPAGDGSARTHEVSEGESVYKLAERYYGDGDKFRVIIRANGLSTDDPIHPGQTLEIPPDPES